MPLTRIGRYVAVSPALERWLTRRGELLGVAALVIIGVALIALAPAKQSRERTSAAVA
jgi:hypothetical protein